MSENLIKKSEIYDRLAANTLDFDDYISIPVKENDEKFVEVQPSPLISVRSIEPAEPILVRETILEKLNWAAGRIATWLSGTKLEIVYGYRRLERQRQLFNQIMQSLTAQYPDFEKRRREAHKLAAIPEAAGHPTGGAVDVQISRGSEPLDFGARIWDLENRDVLTFSPFVSKTATRNRQLLRIAMTSAGFAPFDGEWWHFSFGDKEWAGYYNQPAAFYEQKLAKDLKLL